MTQGEAVVAVAFWLGASTACSNDSKTAGNTTSPDAHDASIEASPAADSMAASAGPGTGTGAGQELPSPAAMPSAVPGDAAGPDAMAAGDPTSTSPDAAGADGSVNPSPSVAEVDASTGGAHPPLPLRDAPGSPGNSIQFAQSGSRLVARGYVADVLTDASDADAADAGAADAGAAKVAGATAQPLFWTFRDTQHGFDCSFMRDESDQIRCVPNTTTEVLYLDSDCAQPLAPALTPRRPTGYYRRVAIEPGDWVQAVSESGAPLVDPEPGRLPTHGRIYQVGEMVFDPDDVAAEEQPAGYHAWDQRAQACVAKDWFRYEIPVLHRLEPVVEAELVPGTLEAIALDDGLFLERVVAEDGAELSAGLWWGSRRCTLGVSSTCIPTPVAEESFWGPGCDERMFTFETPPPLDQAIYGASGQDVFELEYAGMANELTLFSQVEECISVDSSSLDEGRVYRRLENVTGQLPMLEQVTFTSGRLRPRWLVATVAGSQANILVRYVPAYASGTLSISVEVDDGSVCTISHAGAPTGFGGVLEEAHCGGIPEPIPLVEVEL